MGESREAHVLREWLLRTCCREGEVSIPRSQPQAAPTNPCLVRQLPATPASAALPRVPQEGFPVGLLFLTLVPPLIHSTCRLPHCTRPRGGNLTAGWQGFLLREAAGLLADDRQQGRISLAIPAHPYFKCQPGESYLTLCAAPPIRSCFCQLPRIFLPSFCCLI